MKCLNPIVVKVFHTIGGKKEISFGKVPKDYILDGGTFFKRPDGSKFFTPYIHIPCGQCIACRLNYAKLWSIRMMEELKKHDKACFVTLTYDDEHLGYICEDKGMPCLVKEDLQKFWKRLRKERKVRYFACGEYGDRFGRPHYHAIIYGISPDEKDLIEKYWKNGRVHVGTVTEDSCAYVAKYMTKKLRGRALQEKLQQDPNYQNEFVLMSRRPGIGADLSPQMIKYLQDNGIYWRKGKMSGLPRYWKEKFDIKDPFFSFKNPEFFDDFNNYLTNADKISNIIHDRLKFFKRKGL